MKIKVWNFTKKDYEEAEIISVSIQNILVRVGDREFPVQLNDISPEDRDKI